jgi:hypothetical protein
VPKFELYKHNDGLFNIYYEIYYVLLLTEIVSFFFSKTTCFCARKDCAFSSK